MCGASKQSAHPCKNAWANDLRRSLYGLQLFLFLIRSSGWKPAGPVGWRPASRSGHVYVRGPRHHSQWHFVHPLLLGLPPRAPEALQGWNLWSFTRQRHHGVVGKLWENYACIRKLALSCARLIVKSKLCTPLPPLCE